MIRSPIACFTLVEKIIHQKSIRISQRPDPLDIKKYNLQIILSPAVIPDEGRLLPLTIQKE